MSESREERGPIAWMAQNPVAANLLMVGIVAAGIVSAIGITKEVFPEIEPDEVRIQVPYPGASPEEVERGIILAVEEAVREVEHVKRITSTASEGSAVISAELERGSDTQKALMDIRGAVDRITSLPQEAERYQVSIPQRKRGVISMVIYGNVSNVQLRMAAEDLQEQLTNLTGVSTVDISGVSAYEIRVEVSKDIIRQYGLTLADIAAKIKTASIELPAGGIKDETGEVLVRVNERREGALEFAEIPIITEGNGQIRKLGELAKIIDGFDDQDMETSFNGQPAVFLSVYAMTTYSPSEVAQTVNAYLDELKSRLPETLHVTTWDDRGKMFSGRLKLLMQNLGQGLVLVLVILGLFLEPRLAFWVSLGIPISFLGSFLLLPFFGVTFNMMSMFAFIVVLGMVVDDAISIGENIYHLRQKGMPALKASIIGTRQMAAPIVFSVLTTIVAFAPLLFTPGRMGQMQYAIPVIVIAVLSISLAEALFILPAHIAETPMKARGFIKLPTMLSNKVGTLFNAAIDKYYTPFVNLTIRGRWATISVAIMILLITLGLYLGGRIKTIDRPGGDRDEVIAQAELPYGSPFSESKVVEKELIKAANEALSELPENISKGIMSMVGFGRGSSTSGGHLVTVTVLLKSMEERTMSSKEFASIWSKKLGHIVGVDNLVFSADRHGMNRPIDFTISHSDTATLEAAAKEAAAALLTFSGVTEADDGVMDGKPQYSYHITPMGADAGLTAQNIGSQLRAAYYGAEALRQQRGRSEVKVLVSYPREERRSLSTIDDFILTTPGGGEMPLALAARLEKGHAYRSISRTDGRRNLRVQAAVDETRFNAQEIFKEFSAKVMPGLAQKYHGLSYGLRGRQEDMAEFQRFLIMGLIMAVIAIYTLIAIPLKSYLQPLLVVMSAIPFGIVGSVLAHYFLNMPMSMFSYMGLIALAGVVVNDSILLTTTANELRKEGLSPMEAAKAAAVRRFRPIMLTSVTTFCGLAPMITETSAEAQMMIPMAVSLSFGILASTIFILSLVPVLYTIVEEWRDKMKSGEEISEV